MALRVLVVVYTKNIEKMKAKQIERQSGGKNYSENELIQAFHFVNLAERRAQTHTHKYSLHRVDIVNGNCLFCISNRLQCIWMIVWTNHKKKNDRKSGKSTSSSSRSLLAKNVTTTCQYISCVCVYLWVICGWFASKKRVNDHIHE